MTDGSWLRVVCRLGEEAATCRYVVCGREGFRCAKVYDAEMAREGANDCRAWRQLRRRRRRSRSARLGSFTQDVCRPSS